MIISEKKQKIANSGQVAEILSAILRAEDEADRSKEHFWVVGMNNRCVIQYIDLTHLGTLNACPVHPRDIFRLAVMKGVASIIIAHNHPSGETVESKEDRDITQRLQEAGRILGIRVNDSLIIAEDGRYVSLQFCFT